MRENKLSVLSYRYSTVLISGGQAAYMAKLLVTLSIIGGECQNVFFLNSSKKSEYRSEYHFRSNLGWDGNSRENTCRLLLCGANIVRFTDIGLNRSRGSGCFDLTLVGQQARGSVFYVEE